MTKTCADQTRRGSEPLMVSRSPPELATLTCCALMAGVLLQVVVPNGPLTAWFLQPEERVALHKMVRGLACEACQHVRTAAARWHVAAPDTSCFLLPTAIAGDSNPPPVVVLAALQVHGSESDAASKTLKWSQMPRLVLEACKIPLLWYFTIAAFSCELS